MTEDLDLGVGMIVKKVEELGISDRTFVVYMSDHGAGLNLSSNAPLNRGKGTLWEGGLRVPLIISGPEVKAGAFCDVPTVGWDLFPTFCDLAGIDDRLPTGLEGVSLKPLFGTGKHIGGAERQIAFHYPHYRDEGPHSTITSDGYKLIKLYETNELRLFDLRQDIGEKNDLSQVHPDKVDTMHQSLVKYLKNVDAGIPSVNPDFDPRLVVQDGSQRGRGGRGGRGGRRGPSPAQIAERQKEMANLEQALKRREMETVGQLLDELNRSMTNGPPRPQRPRGTPDAPSPRQQRQQELQQLSEAYEKLDVKKLDELIAKIKARLENNASRPTARSRTASGEDAID